MTGAMAAFLPRPRVEKPAFVETAAQAVVSRAALWELAVAARAFHRRATGSRFDSEHFRRSAEAVEKALEAIPVEVFG